MADDETPWYRTLLLSLGALLGVALIVGGVVSVVALGAVNVTGLGETERSTATEEPTLHIPERTGDTTRDDEGLTLEDLNGGVDPTEDDQQSDDPQDERSDQPGKKDRDKREKKRRGPQRVISLSASPLVVSEMERIYLTGTYPGGEGATLQVQRHEGTWSDFPVSTSVSGGTFSTYVQTGQAGVNRFRVVDAASGKKSNTVRVRVR